MNVIKLDPLGEKLKNEFNNILSENNLQTICSTEITGGQELALKLIDLTHNFCKHC